MRSHLLMMRGGEDGQIDVSQYQAAMKHKREMLPDTNPAFIGTSWQSIGPNNLDGTTSSQLDPVTGRVNAVRYNPANPNNYWVGGATGGLMVTSDNGATYQTKSDFWDYTYTSAITVDPTNSNRIYVATGDFPGWWGYGMGIMRSSNGGATWTQELVAELDGCEVSDILVDPDNPSTVIATAGRGTTDPDGTGIWRSTDFGNTWSRVFHFPGRGFSKLSASIRTNNVRRLYAATSAGALLYRSSDGGATWTSVSPPPISGLVSVAASKTHRDVVYCYVGIDGPNGDDDGVVYRSTNAGDTWTDITGNLGNITGSDSDFRQATYNYMFGVMNTAADGTGDDILVLGMVDCFVLRDPQNRTTWQWINGVSGQTRICHADYHGFDQHPTLKNTALIGNDGGVYQLSYFGELIGYIFTTRNQGLVLTEHVFTAPHPDASANPNYVTTGMWHLGCAYSPNNVNDWRSVSGGDGMWTTIDDTNPLIQYVSAQRGMDRTEIDLRVTTNGWVSSAGYSTTTSLAVEDFAFASPWSEIPGDSGAIYLAGERLYEFDLSSGSPVWTKAIGGADFSSQSGEYVTAIRAISNAGCFVGTNDGRLLGSATPSTGMPLIHDFVGGISSIKQHPSDQDNLLVSIGGVDRSPNDPGALWEVIDSTTANRTVIDRSGTGQNSLPGIGVNWVERDPFDPTSTWYAATDLGVFYTRNRGADWYSCSEALGLPNCMVYHLEVSDGFLYASTFGRGIWRMALFSSSPSVTSLVFDDPDVTGGNTTVARVTLSRQSPPGGINITISSNFPSLIPTQSVPFPGGVTAADVTIDTNLATAHTTVTATATLNGSAQDTIIVRECSVSDLILADTVGGDANLFAVFIDRPAPTGGLPVDLVDNDTGTTTPAQVTIQAGSTNAFFSVNTALTPVNRLVSIQASGPGSGWQESFNRLPVFVTGVTATPNPVWNTQPSAIRITLNRNAPASGFPMTVTNGTPAVATAVTNFTIPQGSSSFNNPITTFYVPTDSTAGFRVWDPYQQFWEPTLTVKHLGVSSVNFTPNPIVGGNSGSGTVIVDRTVDSVVLLSVFTDRPDIFSPTDVFIFPGNNSGTFQGDSVAVSSAQNAKITARIGAQSVAGAFAETNLSILPNQIVVVPSTYTLNLGRVDSGNVGSLAANDGNVLRVCKFIVPNQTTPPVAVQVDATAPVTACTGLRFQANARMQTTGLFTQEQELWNWTTAAWDATDRRTDSVGTTLTVREIVCTGTLSRLLRNDGALRARYRIRQTGPAAAVLWCHEAERINWIVTP